MDTLKLQLKERISLIWAIIKHFVFSIRLSLLMPLLWMIQLLNVILLLWSMIKDIQWWLMKCFGIMLKLPLMVVMLLLDLHKTLLITKIQKLLVLTRILVQLKEELKLKSKVQDSIKKVLAIKWQDFPFLKSNQLMILMILLCGWQLHLLIYQIQ